MKWENILKVDINIRDAQRLGRDYSIRDMYEGKLVSQEEYDEMTDEERRNYHGRIANYLRYAERSRGVNLGSLEEELRFHNIMQSRLQQGSILPTYPTYVEGFESQTQGRKPPKVKPVRTKIPILDYFMMYRNRGLGIPTVQNIEEEEGKSLTNEELEEYNNLRERYEV